MGVDLRVFEPGSNSGRLMLVIIVFLSEVYHNEKRADVGFSNGKGIFDAGRSKGFISVSFEIALMPVPHSMTQTQRLGLRSVNTALPPQIFVFCIL